MRGIIFFAGLAMAASWGLTWIEPPFAGPELSPMAAMEQGVITFTEDTPWQTWVFVGGFGAAALAALLSLFGRAAGLFALLAGLSPIVVAGDAYLRTDDIRRDLGLPFEVDFTDLDQAWQLVEDFVRLGLWAYLGGALLLLLAGMSIVFASRR